MLFYFQLELSVVFILIFSMKSARSWFQPPYAIIFFDGEITFKVSKIIATPSSQGWTREGGGKSKGQS
jgi:hypothetical protein